MPRELGRPSDEDRERAFALTPVSRETQDRLSNFVDRLLAYQAHTNLIAPSTIPNLWTRHVADSLQLLDLAPGAKIWVDLGSGGGFPGLVIACAIVGDAGRHVHLVESIKKKATFLESVVADLALPATVHPVRIEDFVQNFASPADVVTARALAPLHKLLGLAAPLLKDNTVGLFSKGQDVASELTEAAKSWTMDVTTIPSRTDALARVLAVRALKRK